MTTRENFRGIMRLRRECEAGSYGHAYLSRTARKLVWIMRGKPVDQWPE